MVALLVLAYCGVMARSWYLQTQRHADFVERSEGQHRSAIKLRARRGDIVDRKGRELAISAMVPSVSAIPAMVPDPLGTAQKLATLLGVDPEVIGRRLARGNQFAWIKRHVTPAEAKAVEAAGLQGVELADEPRRFYPNRSIAGALLGFAGVDGEGLEGIERDFDRFLRGKEYVVGSLRDARGRQLMTGGYLPVEHLSGHKLELTLDLRIQQVAEQALAKQVEAMDAAGGVVIVLDPGTGDVLALAQTPTFDPNLYSQSTPDAWRNRITVDVLEPGSTIKPFVVAAALDAGKVRAEDMWDGMGGRIRVGRKTVSDVHAVDAMNTLEIIQHSSNVGAVQVGQRLGKEAYYGYLRAFGFGEESGLGLQGEVRGTLHPVEKWGLIHLATISYGYGLTVTPMQMARATAAIANGGRLMQPRLVRRVVDAAGHTVEEFPPRVVRRVISEQAARDVTRGLELVTQNGGTGKKARIPGYRVAGKTGTAHKVTAGGYDRNKVRSSWVGFVPAQDPKLVMYVMVDEPKKAQYGGAVAAPIFAAIGREVLPYLGVEATEPVDLRALAAAGADVDLDEEVAEGIDPQARPWWFESPLGGEGPAQVVVPDLKGRPLTEVVAEVESLGVELDVQGAGLVVEQEPKAGGLMAPDARLAVVMALPGEPAAFAAATLDEDAPTDGEGTP
jgi:cell division protein FtsI (penicillin-binding protein 3)